MIGENKIKGIYVGSVISDIRGGLFSEQIGDESGKIFEFTYTSYKICGFDLDSDGDVCYILCNQALYYDEYNRFTFSTDITKFPASDYGEFLFIEHSLGLFNKAREIREKFLQDTAENIRPYRMFSSKIRSMSEDVEVYRSVYVLDVLKEFFDNKDYVKFTTRTYNTMIDIADFDGPYLLSVEDFRGVILNGFLKEEDYMSRYSRY